MGLLGDLVSEFIGCFSFKKKKSFGKKIVRISIIIINIISERQTVFAYISDLRDFSIDALDLEVKC